VLQVSL